METKLRRGIFLTFGITFVLIVATIVVWKLKFYDDVTSQLSKVDEEYKKESDTAKTLNDNLLKEAVAKDRAVLAEKELGYFRQRFRSLNFELANDGVRNETWKGYMNEYFANYGLEMRKELVRAADETNVLLTSSLKIEIPPQMPELVVAPPSGFLKPVTGGTMTVELVGALPDIMRFLNRINRSSILMTVGAIKIEGASPVSKATFTVTPYLVATGTAVVLQAPAGAPAPTGENPEAAAGDGPTTTPPTAPAT